MTPQPSPLTRLLLSAHHLRQQRQRYALPMQGFYYTSDIKAIPLTEDATNEHAEKTSPAWAGQAAQFATSYTTSTHSDENTPEHTYTPARQEGKNTLKKSKPGATHSLPALMLPTADGKTYHVRSATKVEKSNRITVRPDTENTLPLQRILATETEAMKQSMTLSANKEQERLRETLNTSQSTTAEGKLQHTRAHTTTKSFTEKTHYPAAPQNPKALVWQALWDEWLENGMEGGYGNV